MSELTACQIEALRRAAGELGFNYFMDMGLGKTLTVLSEMRILFELGLLDVGVVICPNSFRGGWFKDMAKHGLEPVFDMHVYAASKHKAALRWLGDANGHRIPVIVLNYEAVRLEKTQELLASFTAGRLAYLACDESIKLKNNRSQQAKAVFKMRPQYRFYRNLSGKPTTQGPQDLWSQLTLAGAIQMSWWAFRNRFCQLGGYMDKEVIGVKTPMSLKPSCGSTALSPRKRTGCRHFLQSRSRHVATSWGQSSRSTTPRWRRTT